MREDIAADEVGLDVPARWRVVVWRTDNTADTLPDILVPGPEARPSLLGDSLVVGLAAHVYRGVLRLYRYGARTQRVQWRDLPAALRSHATEGYASLAPNAKYIAFFISAADGAIPSIGNVETGAILRQLAAVALPAGDVQRAAASWESPVQWVFFLDPFEGDSSGHWWVRVRGTLDDSTVAVDTVSAAELMERLADSAHAPHN